MRSARARHNAARERSTWRRAVWISGRPAERRLQQGLLVAGGRHPAGLRACRRARPSRPVRRRRSAAQPGHGVGIVLLGGFHALPRREVLDLRHDRVGGRGLIGLQLPPQHVDQPSVEFGQLAGDLQLVAAVGGRLIGAIRLHQRQKLGLNDVPVCLLIFGVGDGGPVGRAMAQFHRLLEGHTEERPQTLRLPVVAIPNTHGRTSTASVGFRLVGNCLATCTASAETRKFCRMATKSGLLDKVRCNAASRLNDTVGRNGSGFGAACNWSETEGE